MGTNYYWTQPDNVCEHCGRGDGDEFHIGKSSAGWCFLLRVHPDEGINGLKDWNDRWFLKGSVIKDEYGTTVSPGEMRSIITNRHWDRNEPFDEQWLTENYAAPGPNGLARHTYGAWPGEGTYDLCNHEFS